MSNIILKSKYHPDMHAAAAQQLVDTVMLRETFMTLYVFSVHYID